MTGKTSFLKERNLIIIGRRFGSDAVALEAAEASARWSRDEAALAGYGFGAGLRTEFEADRAKHEALLASRSQAVAAKKNTYLARDAQVARGWAWVDRVKSMLGVLALTDETLATGLATAMPDDDAGLAPGIQALTALLAKAKDRLPADAQASERLAESESIVADLGTAPGALHTRGAQTVADTAQIDLLDGKLSIWIRELNQAGRRAIRNGHLRAARQDYVFHHLNRSGAPAAQPEPKPAQPAAPAPAS